MKLMLLHIRICIGAEEFFIENTTLQWLIGANKRNLEMVVKIFKISVLKNKKYAHTGNQTHGYQMLYYTIHATWSNFNTWYI